jgi:hypothetical protein
MQGLLWAVAVRWRLAAEAWCLSWVLQWVGKS